MTISHHRVTYRNRRGQEIVGVLDVPSVRRWPGVVFLVPGFERQVYHYGPVSESLCRHGFATLRTDLTNHVGASEGSITQFTLASAAEDIGAVVEAVAAGGEPVIVVPSSLSARSATRVIADEQRAHGLILLLPVVDVEYTVRQASVSFNLDDWRSGALQDPHQLAVIVEHEIEVEFARAAIADGWCGVDSVGAEIARVRAPVTAICAREDDWVRAVDVEQAMSAPGAGPREVVILEATSHQLTKNPIAVRLLIESLLTTVERMAGVLPEPVVHLAFEEVVAVVRRERRWGKSQYHDLSEEESVTVPIQSRNEGVHV